MNIKIVFTAEVYYFFIALVFILIDRYIIAISGKGDVSAFFFTALIAFGAALYKCAINNHAESISSLRVCKYCGLICKRVGILLFITGVAANVFSWAEGLWFYSF